MTDEARPVTHARNSVAARFFTRLYRYKNLLRTRWWILALATALGVGIELFLVWQAPPAYVSAGRMILSFKLSLPNASVYSEELNNFFGTQLALMESASVMNRVQLRLQALKSPDW